MLVGVCIVVDFLYIVCTMVGRPKRAETIEERPRNVKEKDELSQLEWVVITNMEPIKLELCWAPKRRQDFCIASLFGFFRWSPPVDFTLVEEFVRNYNSQDGSSIVKNRVLGIEAGTLEKVLYLPIAKLAVGEEVSADFVSHAHFKSGVGAFKKRQSWRVLDALTLELGEWMRFVLKRLALN